MGLFNVVVSVIDFCGGDDERQRGVVFLLGQYLLYGCDDERSGYIIVFEMLVELGWHTIVA